MAIYVIGPFGGPYKMGTMSASVEKRLANLQTGSDKVVNSGQIFI